VAVDAGDSFERGVPPSRSGGTKKGPIVRNNESKGSKPKERRFAVSKRGQSTSDNSEHDQVIEWETIVDRIQAISPRLKTRTGPK
jgi:hypothetical protein